MKEIINEGNLKIYRIVSCSIIILMIVGVLTSPFFNIGILIQALFVIAISYVLIIYPKNETNFYKGLLVYLTAGYFYSTTFVYTETTLHLLFVVLLPGIAIIFFHKTTYYTIAIINVIFGTFIFVYAYNQPGNFLYLKADLIGNILNFYASQLIILLVFFMTNLRVEQLKRYYEEIQKAERLKTTGQLAAAVAHEIRNPITVVHGFLQYYKEDSSFSEQTKQHFTLMLEELQSAETVISDFLSITKPVKEKTSVIDLQEVIRGVVDLVSSYAHLHNVSFTISLNDDLYIECGKMECKQLIVNLFKNAIDAMPQGGEVKVSSYKQKNILKIDIVDTGIGMTEEELKALGTPFYSLKTKGTGLGVMICHQIMEKNEGKIEYKSEKGKGTKVSLTFKEAHI
ncbi:HAMP domain-containing histidine kinase [Bacillus timonensis]|nr:HAMP domain-containing histidine kinase [Bacillus timonensis]